MVQVNEKQMIWQDGKLWVSPQGKGNFFYWRSFSWLVRLHQVKLKQFNIMEQRIGLYEKKLNHSDGWFAYQILRDIGYNLIKSESMVSLVH